MPGHPGEGQGTAVSARLRQFLDTLFTTLQTRAELFALELREEKVRWIEVALLGAVVFLFGQLGLLLLTLALAVLFPHHAAIVLSIGGLLFLSLAAVCLAALRRRLKNRPPPFADSVAELKKDREWLSSMN